MRDEKHPLMIKMILLALLTFQCVAVAAEKPEIFVQLGNIQDVSSVAFSPDRKTVLSGSWDGYLRIWDITTGRELRTFQGHEGAVASVAFSPDGLYILSGSWDLNGFKLWEVSTGKELRTFRGHYGGAVLSVAFSPDGRYALSGSYDNTMKIWDISTGKELKTFEGKVISISSVAFSPDGQYVMSGSWENHLTPWDVSIWDIDTGKKLRTFRGHEGPVTSVAFSPDGRYALSGSYDNTMKIWDIVTGKELKTFKGHKEKVWSVAFSPDGRYALSGSSDKTMKIWDILTVSELKTFEGYASGNTSFALSPDGRYGLSGSHDKTMKLWDVTTGKWLRTFKGHENSVSSVNFSPDGRYALSGSYDKTMKLWDVTTGKELRTFKGHENSISSVNFSPDGRYALSGSHDKTMKLWDISTSKEVRSFEGHSSIVYSVAFSSDGQNILSGSLDKTMKLWNVSTGKELRTFQGHLSVVFSVTFSPDSRYVLSGSWDATTRIWDIHTGKEIAQFIGFTDGEWITITPEGYFNASANGAKHLNVRVGNAVYSIDNFYERFFNPVYVASVLQGKEVKELADIRKGVLVAPVTRITSPTPDASFSTDTIKITVRAQDKGGGIDEIRLYHNGKVVGEEVRGLKIAAGNDVAEKTYTVTLVDGLNIFRATGFSRDRTESNPYELTVKLTAPQKEIALHVFAVGLNKYQNPALNLSYAEPDAKGIIAFFREKGKGLFKDVYVTEIFNEEATKATIFAKLKELEKTSPQDVVLIYLAGHGENIDDKWYFIPYELTYPEREEAVKTKGISSIELADYVKQIKAQKVLVVIDACKAGAMLIAFRGFEDRKALSQLSRSTGVHVIAASTKDQFAAETQELGHGVFTYTLLEGLKGKAAGGTDTVTVRKLMGYVEEQLPEITKKYKREAQYPVVDSRGMDFPLVVVK